MRRRDFITLLGVAPVWPRMARAQNPAMPLIGFLHVGSAKPFQGLVAALRQGLKETGYTERENVAIEF
ncbi:MAG: ABC transporter substrate-binding protein, partial [Pseudolabrys sp.]